MSITVCGYNINSSAGSRPADYKAQRPHTLIRQVKVKIDYLLYMPEDYKDDGKPWPLMIFLHGAGERGSDLKRIRKHGPPKLIEDGKKLPFIILSPQCPSNKWWPDYSTEVLALIEEAVEKYNVDESRIYLTGHSMGGYGTWSIGCKYAEKFAAIAPICGGGNPYIASNLKNVPVWAFHGAKDNVVPLKKSQDMVAAIKKFGGDAKLTVYPNAKHDSWTKTYNNDELYKWLLSHTKKQK